MSTLVRFRNILSVHRGLISLHSTRTLHRPEKHDHEQNKSEREKSAYYYEDDHKRSDLRYGNRSFLDAFSEIKSFSGVGRINHLILRKDLVSVEEHLLFERLEKYKKWTVFTLEELFVANTDDFNHLLEVEKEVLDNIPDDIKVYDFQVMMKAKEFDVCDRWLTHIHEERQVPSVFTYLMYIEKWGKLAEQTRENYEERVIQIYTEIKDQINYLPIINRAVLLENLLKTRLSRSELYDTFTIEGKLPEHWIDKKFPTNYKFQLRLLYLLQDQIQYDEAFETFMAMCIRQGGNNLPALANEYRYHAKFCSFEKLAEGIKRMGDKISMEVADQFMEALHSGREGYIARLGQVDIASGECSNCRKKLKEFPDFTEERMNMMRRTIHDQVFLRGNVFYNTTEEEAKAFLTFIKYNGPFDFVVDVPNIGASLNQSGTPYRLERLEAIVSTIRTENPSWKIFMLDKKVWRTSGCIRHLQAAYRNIYVFDILNETIDDPFLLYATIASGNGTSLVSFDKFRNYKAIIKDTDLLGDVRRFYYASLLQPNRTSRDLNRVRFRRDFDPVQDDGEHLHITIDDDEKYRWKNLMSPLPVVCVEKESRVIQ